MVWLRWVGSATKGNHPLRHPALVTPHSSQFGSEATPGYDFTKDQPLATIQNLVLPPSHALMGPLAGQDTVGHAASSHSWGLGQTCTPHLPRGLFLLGRCNQDHSGPLKC